PSVRPASITQSRVLLTLSGFLLVVNGVIDLGPLTGGLAKSIGIALILVGLACWLLVYRLSRLVKKSASLQRRSFRTSRRCRPKRQVASSEARMLSISTYGGALMRGFSSTC